MSEATVLILTQDKQNVHVIETKLQTILSSMGGASYLCFDSIIGHLKEFRVMSMSDGDAKCKHVSRN